MKTLESSLLHQSWPSLPPKKRYQLMALLPYMEDPTAKLLILRVVARSMKHYRLIRALPNSSEVIFDLFDLSLKWITEQPRAFTFPMVKALGWEFLPPDDRFEKVTFGQLVELDSYYTRYLRTQKEMYFESFLTNLYAVAREGEAPIHQAISKVEDPFRLDALRMYGMIREKLFTAFKHLFPQPKSPSKKGTDKPIDFRKIQDTTAMWHSILFSLAETPAYQGMATAKAAGMWEALTYLDEKAFQAEKKIDNKI